MSLGVPIIPHPPRLRSVNSMIFPDPDILAGEPECATLLEDYVARNNVFGRATFETETAAGTVAGTVGAALLRV